MTNLFKSPKAIPVREFISMRNEGELNLDADYQRPFVWTDEPQIELIRSFVEEYPIGNLSVIYRTHAQLYCEVVDGKQRISTLLSFFDNKVPYVNGDGEHVYFNDMDEVEQRRLKMYTLPVSGLNVATPTDEPSRLSILRFFYRINFNGVPQTEEHRLKIAAEMAELEAD